MLEKQPVLICNDDMNFEFDDTNEINEDTIIVTGFTVRSRTANIFGSDRSSIKESQCLSTIQSCLYQKPNLFFI